MAFKPGIASIGAFAFIGLIVGAGAIAFAYTGGWLSPDRLTPDRMVDALSRRGGDPVGHRRNHAKGICFTGNFVANGAGARLSTAPMLASGTHPVIGRFAIAVGDPATPDAEGRVRSMAVRITAPDGQEWRSGMNNIPVFPVSTPQAFYELTLAQDVDPATGKPNAAPFQQFVAAHAEIKPFLEWAETAPWTTSYVDQTYNSLNAFRFIASDGNAHLVRWAMETTTPPHEVPKEALAGLGPDFLERDLKQRVVQGPLSWHLVVTLAAPDDPSDNAAQAWPANREKVDVGTLTVDHVEDEADGPCRDINYDPTILPVGIQPSDDSLLAARSSAYAVSFDRRESESAAYPRTPADSGASR